MSGAMPPAFQPETITSPRNNPPHAICLMPISGFGLTKPHRKMHGPLDVHEDSSISSKMRSATALTLEYLGISKSPLQVTCQHAMPCLEVECQGSLPLCSQPAGDSVLEVMFSLKL